MRGSLKPDWSGKMNEPININKLWFWEDNDGLHAWLGDHTPLGEEDRCYTFEQTIRHKSEMLYEQRVQNYVYKIENLERALAVMTDKRANIKDVEQLIKINEQLEKSLTSSLDKAFKKEEENQKKIDYLQSQLLHQRFPEQQTGYELPKQARYSKGNYDYIDDTYESMPFERFVGAIQWTIGKYFVRFGKKDDLVSEATKIADYANRFLEKVKLHVEAQNEKSEKPVKK